MATGGGTNLEKGAMARSSVKRVFSRGSFQIN